MIPVLDPLSSGMEIKVWASLGEEGVNRLVAAFYRRVREDDLIGPMYPPDDWAGAERRLADFLIFRLGGSDRYIQERGHPRLRMRHLPFAIGVAERDRWLALMKAAMGEVGGLEGEVREWLEGFFTQVADFMRNQPN